MSGAYSIRERTWAAYSVLMPLASRRCETRRKQLNFQAALFAVVFTWFVKVRVLFTSTPSMETDESSGSVLPFKTIAGEGAS